MIPAHVLDSFDRAYHDGVLPHYDNPIAIAHRQAVDAGLRAAIPAYLHHQAEAMRAEGSGRLAIVVSHSLDGIAAELEPPCPATLPSPCPPGSTPPTCSASASTTASKA